MQRGNSVTATWRWAKQTFPLLMQGVNYSTVARHNRMHVGPVKRAAAKLSDADRMVRKQIRLARDVLEDRVDPQAFFGPAAIAQDLHKTSARLDSAAEEAFEDGEHASLAGLSSVLIRSYDLRAKMGGSINDNPSVNLTVSLGELHSRLDSVLGTTDVERHAAARGLLGLPGPGPAPMPGPATTADLRDDSGLGVTIDAEPNPPADPIVEPAPMPVGRPPLTQPMARKIEAIRPSSAEPEASHDAAWRR